MSDAIARMPIRSIRLQAAREIRGSLQLSEQQALASVTETHRLIATLLDTKARSSVPTTTGMDAIGEAFAAGTAFAEGITRLEKAHLACFAVAGKVGVDVKAIGDTGPSPTALPNDGEDAQPSQRKA